jgi:hypothetical protein
MLEVKFNGNKYVYTAIEDYLSHNKNRARIFFYDKKLGIKYYMIINCLVVGTFGQQLMPIENNACGNIIFKESFTYDHDENVRKALLYNIFCEENISDFIFIDEAVPLYHVWSSNFWHWTFECLLKVLALEERGYTGHYIVFDCKFINEYLELFNISKERICYTDKRYIVKNLIVPSTFTGHDLSQYSVDYLRSKILDATGILSGNNRIYVKRTKNRIVTNEDEVIDILKKYDFNILIPEEYSVKDQFLLMTNVDFSIMAHGANCTLTLAQKINSIFMEFFSNVYIEYHMIPTIKTLNLQYIPLVDNRNYQVVIDNNQNKQSSNITVPIKIFETIIENILKKHNTILC